jgi:uncharacterized delta-60 repeat protein
LVSRVVRIAIVAVGLNAAATGVATAASGDLDETFSDDGVVRTNFSRGHDSAAAVAIQPDGRIVAAGRSGGRDGKLALARYHPDGSLDDTFGGDGKVVTNLAADDLASDLVIQPDGMIVVAGRTGGSGGRFATVRYESNGDLDEAFGVDGVVVTNFSRGNDYASGVAIQGDGKLVVVGRARERPETEGGRSDSAFALARYLPDGSRDLAFSRNGKVLTNLTQGWDFALDVAVQGDEMIVVVGRGGGTSGRFALVRYRPRGALDATFGGDGKVFTEFARRDDLATSLALQPDGMIVVAGTAVNAFALARYGTAGSLDPSFSGDGKVVTRFREYFEDSWTTFEIAHDVAIQSDGKIVAAGTSHRSVLLGMCCDTFTAIARFTPEGILDDTFSEDGKVVDDIGPSHGANGVAIQSDGKIVTAGEAFLDPPVSTFLLLRYLAA